MRLNLPCLHLPYYPFREAVGTVGVVFLGEAGTEEGGEGLIKAGFYGAKEGLDELVTR